MPFASPHIAVGLNTDDDQAVMPPGDYRWLLNGRVGKSQVENAGTVENILGMLEIDSEAISSQIRIVGWRYNKKLDEIYLLGYHPNKVDHSIYVLSQPFYHLADKLVKIVTNENLGFTGSVIWSITLAGDELVWTNREGEIRRINIPKAKEGGYDGAEEGEMVLIRKGPIAEPVVTFSLNTSETNEEDSLGEDTYQFAYRYIYDNNQYSVLSPWSKTISQTEEERNKVIWVDATADSTPIDVKKIEYLVKINNNTEWQIVGEQTLDTPLTIFKYRADVLGITINNNDAYKIVDAIPRDVFGLDFMKNRLFIANYKTGYALKSTSDAITGTVQPGDANTKIGFGFNTTVQLAIQYYDKYGRPSGALMGNRVSTGNLTRESDNQYLSVIDWSLNEDNLEIPEWAYTYQILRTDDQKKSFFLQDRYIDGWFMYEDELDGTRTWGKHYRRENEQWQWMMFDITLLNSSGIGYTFSEGDKIQFWFRGKLYTKDIEFVDGRFIAIKVFVDGETLFWTFQNGETDNFQIYSPTGAEQETTLYEIGETYSIKDAGTSTRDFSKVNGTIENGDTHLVGRGLAHYDLTFEDYYVDDPYANTLIVDNDETKERQSMNAFDDNYAVWVKGFGRVTVVYESPGEQQSTTTVRFSEERIPDSTINNINKWNVLDRYDKIGQERSPIVKLTKARNKLIANHLRNTTSISVQEEYIQTVGGTGGFLSKTDGVITDDREMAGGYGCIPESVCEFEGRMWWADPYQGTIVRYLENGTQSITDKKYKVGRYFKDLLENYIWYNNKPEHGFNDLPYAGYDPEFQEYFITCPSLSTSRQPVTMVFSEVTQRWVGEFDYRGNRLPDTYFRTNYKSYSAEGQKLYRFHEEESPGYNNFFGRQFFRKLTLVVNPEAQTMKVWNNVWFTKIDLVSDEFDDPVIVITNKYGQEAHIYASDFINSEGIWKAPIYFDRNTLNMTAEHAQRNGDRMRSEWIQLEIESDLTTLDAHVLTQVLWKQSEFTR